MSNLILGNPMIHPPRLPKPMPTGDPEPLADHTHIYQAMMNGLDYNDLNAGGLFLEQVKARKVQLMRSRLPGLRIVDSFFEMCEFSGSQWETGFFRRVVFKDCRLLGTQMLEGIFEDVEFINCQAESLAMVSAKFKNCLFHKCVLKKATFDGADASRVIFNECDLISANFHLAKLKETDFRTSDIGGLQVGVTEMQGAIIAPHQTLQVVGLLGVTVKEIEDSDQET
ncbi:hypothetical protein hrd7_20680 [Leptolinea sp. HRD-7]|nr:hypothetical protein hrd7_20680 [Leptolinea sp. HRD-7]